MSELGVEKSLRIIELLQFERDRIKSELAFSLAIVVFALVFFRTDSSSEFSVGHTFLVLALISSLYSTFVVHLIRLGYSDAIHGLKHFLAFPSDREKGPYQSHESAGLERFIVTALFGFAVPDHFDYDSLHRSYTGAYRRARRSAVFAGGSFLVFVSDFIIGKYGAS